MSGDGDSTLAEDLLLLSIDPGTGRLDPHEWISSALAGCWIAELVLAQVAYVVNDKRVVVIADLPNIPPHLVPAVRRVRRRFRRNRGNSLSYCVANLSLFGFLKYRARARLMERGLLRYVADERPPVLRRFRDSSFEVTDLVHVAARRDMLERTDSDPRAHQLAALAHAVGVGPYPGYRTAIASAVEDAILAAEDSDPQ